MWKKIGGLLWLVSSLTAYPCVASTTFRAFIAVKPPESLNPFQSSDGITSDHLNQIFETLFWIDYDGNLKPLLATEWKRLDEKTVEVKLRQGVKFQNGEDFDSGAVKFSFDTFANPEKPAANRQYGETIAGLDVVDKYTVRIRSSTPDSFLVYRLALVPHIVPPAYYAQVGDTEFAKAPIGTGPFRFVGTAKEGLPVREKMILAANSNYWGTRPKIDQLEFHYYSDFQAVIKALESKKLDFAAHVPGTFNRNLMRLKPVRIVKKLTRQSIMVLVNTKKKNSPLASKEFRIALRNAVNFGHVIKYGYLGNGVVTNSLTVKGEPFHDENIPEVGTTTKVSPILKAAPNYKFRFQVTEPFGIAGKIVSEQMKLAGMNVETAYGSDSDEAREVLNYNRKGAIPEIDFLFSYCSHRDALGAFPLMVLMPSNGNWSLTADPEFDRILRDAVNEFDFEKQKKKFKTLNRYVYDNALVLPGFQLNDIFAVQRTFSFTPNVTAYLYFKDVGVLKR
mgnify:CR=1 FL=1